MDRDSAWIKTPSVDVKVFQHGGQQTWANFFVWNSGLTIAHVKYPMTTLAAALIKSELLTCLSRIASSDKVHDFLFKTDLDCVWIHPAMFKKCPRGDYTLFRFQNHCVSMYTSAPTNLRTEKSWPLGCLAVWKIYQRVPRSQRRVRAVAGVR